MKRNFPYYDIGHWDGERSGSLEFEIFNFYEVDKAIDGRTKNDLEHRHKHSFYAIMWVDSGHISQVIENQTYTVKRNGFFFISPGQVHQNILKKSTSLKGGIILFSPKIFDKKNNVELPFLEEVYFKPYLELSKQQFLNLRQVIDLLLLERKQFPQDVLVIQSLLLVLLLQIQRCFDVQQVMSLNKRSRNIYRSLKQLVESHYKEGKPVSAYASTLNITSRQLNRLVKENTGKTVQQLISERVILEAKRMLALTDHSISEIACQLSFDDNSYFTKVFKKEVGITPKQFRTKNVQILP